MARVTAAHASALASLLTERDRKIIADCYEHRVLTSEQIRRLHFGATRTAQVRLGKLYRLRLLDRFRPPWRHGEGSTPLHWVLDEAGAYVIAEHRGIERSELRWRHDAAIGLASSSTLRHQVEVNEFFTRLSEEARASGGTLRTWWGERRCREALDGIAVPDGYGLIELPETAPAAFLLELDRATEDHSRLVQKTKRYAKALARSELADDNPIVIIAAPSAGRVAAIDARCEEAASRWPSSVGRRSDRRWKLSSKRSARRLAADRARELSTPRCRSPRTRDRAARAARGARAWR